MKKRLICIFLIMFSVFSMVNVIHATEINYYGSSGTAEHSDSCGGNFCATDIKGSGFRISLVYKTGGKVKNTKEVNFYPGGAFQSPSVDSNGYVGGYYCGNIGTVVNNISSAVDSSSLFATDINSNNLVGKYQTFFNNLNISTLNTIIKYLIPSGSKVQDYYNYYLKFEPIYVIKEKLYPESTTIFSSKYTRRCQFFSGTSKEILNSFGTRQYIAGWFGTIENKNKYGSGAGKYYVAGGNNNYISGSWNVVRNYIVGIYTECKSSEYGKNNIFDSKNGKCFPSNKSINSSASTINSWYNTSTGYGLGVGYVSIKDYLGTIIITKQNTSGTKLSGATFQITVNGTNKTCTTNTNGQCSFTNVPFDTYAITETKAPAGYSTAAVQYVTVSSSNQNAYITITDSKKEGTIIITKQNTSGTKLSGAKFQITVNGTNKTCTTNTNGQCSFTNVPYGKYAITETKAPEGYEKTDSINITLNSESKTVTVTDEATKVNVIVEKYSVARADSSTALSSVITDSSKLSKLSGVRFYICKKNGNSCVSGTNVDGVTNSNGRIVFKLSKNDKGKYYLVEQIPTGYSSGENDAYAVGATFSKSTTTLVYYEFEFNGTSKTIKVYNAQDCVYAFNNTPNVNSDDLSAKIKARVDLYNKYSLKGKNLNQLLNLNKTVAEDACKYEPIALNPKTECMSSNIIYSPASYRYGDLSHYNSTIEYEGETVAYCFSSVEIGSSDKSVVFPTTPIKSGQMVISSKNSSALEISISQECYFIKDVTNLSASDKVSNYITDVNLTFNGINYLIQVDEGEIEESGSYSVGDIAKFKGTSVYDFLNIYAIHGNSGTIKYDIIDNYRNLGAGIVSSFSDEGEIEGIFSFKYKAPYSLNSKLLKMTPNDDNTYTLSATCSYTAENELVSYDDKTTNYDLNLVFRQIDTSNPFPGKTGKELNNQRIVGSNWQSKDLTLNQSDYNTIYSSIDEGSEVSESNEENQFGVDFDLNKDGEVNVIDSLIYKVYINNYSNNDLKKTGDNYLVKYVMSRNNSKNQTGEGAKYTIELDSKLIKEIRKYNSTTTYDDYDKMNCSSNTCTSPFLREVLGLELDTAAVENTDEDSADDDGFSWCLVKGTKIKTYNGYKNVEDITYSDLLAVYSYELGKVVYEYPLLIEKEGTINLYQKITFSDGTTLSTYGGHGIFSKDANKFVSVIDSDNFHVGTTVYKVINNKLKEVKVTKIEYINEKTNNYNITTARYFNLLANDFLTTDPIIDYANMYEFNSNVTWSNERDEYLKTNDFVSYNYIKNYFPKYLYYGLRVNESKYLLNKDYSYLSKYYSIYKSASFEDLPKDSDGNNLWLVTTSEELNNNMSGNYYKEGSIYTLPSATKYSDKNFIGWYSSSDNKYYKENDKVIVNYGMYFEAIYEDKDK